MRQLPHWLVFPGHFATSGKTRPSRPDFEANASLASLPHFSGSLSHLINPNSREMSTSINWWQDKCQNDSLISRLTSFLYYFDRNTCLWSGWMTGLVLLPSINLHCVYGLWTSRDSPNYALHLFLTLEKASHHEMFWWQSHKCHVLDSDFQKSNPCAEKTKFRNSIQISYQNLHWNDKILQPPVYT